MRIWPKYLAKIPIDLFSARRFIYRATEMGYLLYSVGVNGKDESGVYDDDPPGMISCPNAFAGVKGQEVTQPNSDPSSQTLFVNAPPAITAPSKTGLH